METFDTNVVVRLIVLDDAEQCRWAEEAWQKALDQAGVFLPSITLVETAWVLRRAYRFDKDQIAASLRRLLDISGVVAENEGVFRAALTSYGKNGADLSDYVILESGRQAGALPVRTFDRRLARETDVELLPSDH